jgi:NAD(P)-dependent dehydrogenase (short-subunit alcohol dehydrogenase family)
VASVFAHSTPTLRKQLRGLVGCAGVSDNGPSIDSPVPRFQRLLEINVAGNSAVAQAAAHEMRRTNSTGSIVLVASMSGYVSNKVGCLYLNAMVPFSPLIHHPTGSRHDGL